MGFSERVVEWARLQVLRSLEKAPDYTSADVILHTALRDEGVPIQGLSALRVELAWLNSQGLVVTQQSGGSRGVTLATLTDRGLDVAQGMTVPGVARPRPGS